MRWSESDNYFVSGRLKVYSVDLNSPEPLKLIPEEDVKYNGPMGDDFKSLLLDNGFRVNRQGKAIVRVPKRNDEEDYNFFLLEKVVVQLGPYGFINEPSLTQEVREMKRLLEENRQDQAKMLLEENRQDAKKLLEKNGEEVRELKRLVEENRQEAKRLVEENGQEVKELKKLLRRTGKR